MRFTSLILVHILFCFLLSFPFQTPAEANQIQVSISVSVHLQTPDNQSASAALSSADELQSDSASSSDVTQALPSPSASSSNSPIIPLSIPYMYSVINSAVSNLTVSAPDTTATMVQIRNLLCIIGALQTTECQAVYQFYHQVDWSTNHYTHLIFSDYISHFHLAHLYSESHQCQHLSHIIPIELFIKSKNFGGICTGYFHFLDNLTPSFSKYIGERIQQTYKKNEQSKIGAGTSKTASMKAFVDNQSELIQSIYSMRIQHKQLLNNAVIPGFKVLGKIQHQFTTFYSRMGQMIVPIAASTLREFFIMKHLNALIGFRKSKAILDKVKEIEKKNRQ
jgi:hypothetical protein